MISWLLSLKDLPVLSHHLPDVLHEIVVAIQLGEGTLCIIKSIQKHLGHITQLPASKPRGRNLEKKNSNMAKVLI